jgi:predicted alternative tryptophan synthase beta-subunit
MGHVAMAAGFAWKFMTFSVVGVRMSYSSCQKLARRKMIYQYCVTVVPQPPDMQK